MKRTTAIWIAALALAAAAAVAERYTPARGSFVRIEGTSTLHAWTMEGKTIRGEIDAPAIESWTRGAAPAVTVSIPINSIKSEHARMDKLMADALKAKAHPEIRYELTESSLEQGDVAAFTMRSRGKLTIAGVTREIAMSVSGTRAADGSYVLTGSAPIRMTDFGIKPPTAMLNTIKTGDDVNVTFRWAVERSN